MQKIKIKRLISITKKLFDAAHQEAKESLKKSSARMYIPIINYYKRTKSQRRDSSFGILFAMG